MKTVRIRLGPLAPLLLVQLQSRLHISPHELEPIRSIRKIAAPILTVAGSNDEHTTLEESEELFHAAVEPKQLWVVEGAFHQDFQTFDPIYYESELVEFLLERLQWLA